MILIYNLFILIFKKSLKAKYNINVLNLEIYTKGFKRYFQDAYKACIEVNFNKLVTLKYNKITFSFKFQNERLLLSDQNKSSKELNQIKEQSWLE